MIEFPKDLVDKILLEIATAYPYSIEDIKLTFNMLNSIDQTIAVCESGLTLGFSSPVIALNSLRGKYSLDKIEGI